MTKNVRVFLRHRWRVLLACLVSVLLIPLPVCVGTQESKCGYAILVTSVFWMLEPMHLAATSLLPVVLLPLLGVCSTQDVSSQYMNATNMMFFGGLMMAVIVEHCSLHKRIALNLLVRVQPTVPRLMFCFMMTAMFLSMWTSNLATCAIMVPIVEVLLSQMEGQLSKVPDNEMRDASLPVEVTNNNNRTSFPSEIDNDHLQYNGTAHGENNTKEQAFKSKTVRTAMLLSIAYSSNIGGTATVTGTAANVIMKGIVEDRFPNYTDLSFDKWMMYNTPVAILCVLVAWLFLYLVYLRRSVPTYSKDTIEDLKQVLRKKHDEIGPMTTKEKTVTVLFAILLCLWIFRDPNFIRGWGSFFPTKVTDATPAIAIPLLMFLLPTDPWSPSPPMMDWKTAQEKFPWSIIILMGGGFALAEGSKQSGLSLWISDQLSTLHTGSSVALVIALTVFAGTLTEFMSNTAVANVLLPVVAQLADSVRVHPVYFMMPVTVACSFAFVLPIATPPNATVYEAGNMSVMDMVKPGLFMSILCLAIELVMINTLGSAVFDFSDFADWTNKTVQLNTTLP